MKKIIHLIFLGAFLFACTSETTNSTDETTDTATTEDVVVEDTNDERSTTNNALYNDLMLPTTGGVFRGIHFDMTRSQVYDIETSRSTIDVYKDETDEELVVTTDMGKEILNFGDITYRFDEQGLYAIKVETYATTLEVATEVFDMIVEEYNSRYGEATIAEDGYSEWTATDSETGYDYAIAVKNIDDIDDSFGMYMYFDIL